MFGEYLARIGAVSTAELSEALETQRLRPALIGRILRELGTLSSEDLNRYLEGYFTPRTNVPVTDIESKIRETKFSETILLWSKENGLIPWKQTDSEFHFICGSFSDEVISKAENEFKKRCLLFVLESEAYLYLRASIFGRDAVSVVSIVQERLSDEQKISRTGAYTSLFRDVLDTAQKEGASDIHIQPERSGLTIRIRVNGDLTPIKVLGVEHRQSFINEAKRLCDFSIAVSGEGQDGRISLPGRKLDLRTSLIPTQYGEKIVLRLLDLSRDFNLGQIGFTQETIDDLREALLAKNGVIVVSGPTGSGKTTLLYTLLCALDRESRNIVTLEDPIEYQISGLAQTQVSEKLSFAQALRSILRQDPDVILVGEIRDHETADLCVKAASTGHLVLSTLHANSAPEVVSRLLNLGVDRFMLTSCLRFSAGQRLVKKLCSKCALETTPVVRSRIAKVCLKNKIRIGSEAHFRMRNRAGCSDCREGVTGRAPILEYLKADQIRAHLSQGSDGVDSKYVSLLQSALKTSERGEIDVCEALELE